MAGEERKEVTSVNKRWLTGMLLIALACWVTGCMDKGEERFRETVGGKFEILWDLDMGLSPAVAVIQPLQAAFPDATFHYTNIMRHPKPTDVRENFWPFHQYDVVRYDTPADLVVFEHILAPHYIESGYLEPLDDFVAADLTILEALDPELLEHVRRQGDGSLYAIPFAKNAYALYYNKDLFDELQLPYPTDGMTWDDVFALARQIEDRFVSAHKTTIGSVERFQVITERSAFGLPDRHLALSQLGGRFPDPEGGMADFRDPVWDRYDAFLAELDSLKSPMHFYIYKDFAEGNLVMTAGRLHGSQHYSGGGDTETDMLMAPFADWDMVSFPVFADAPDTGPAPAYYYVGIAKNSVRKQEAFRLISHLLTDDVQMENSRNGLVSVRSEPEFREVFAERTYGALGKNTPAFLYHPKEATLGPDYDHFLQYDFYQFRMSGDNQDRHLAALRDRYLELEEYRQMWLEKYAFERE